MRRTGSGYLACGLPYDRIGDGPTPLVAIVGLLMENKPDPKGQAKLLFGPLAFLEDAYTIYFVQRRPGLPVGTSVADMAADYARMIASEFGHAVDVIGVSNGGLVGLQLAIDHPEAVERLVVYSSAYRLGDGGRGLQRRCAELARQGKGRAAIYESLKGVVAAGGGVGAALVRPLLWGLSRLAPVPADLSDYIATIEAMVPFDASTQLSRIKAPTLVIGGGRDPLYSEALFRETAAGIPRARLLFEPAAGHVPTGKAIEAELGTFLRD